VLVLVSVLIISLIATLGLIVAFEALLDRPLALIPLGIAGLSFLLLITSDDFGLWALTTVALFVPFAVLAFAARWTYTNHGRLERAYWRKSDREILGGLFRKYSLDDHRNRTVTEEIEEHLHTILPRDWHALIGDAARELAAVKITSKRVRSLGISPATAAAYTQTTDIAGDHLWRVTERVAAVIAQGYSSPGIDERLHAERDRVEKLIAAAGSAREALAELTLGDTGSGELEGVELQLRMLTSATRELEIV
jgi:hypothetical protein